MNYLTKSHYKEKKQINKIRYILNTNYKDKFIIIDKPEIVKGFNIVDYRNEPDWQQISIIEEIIIEDLIEELVKELADSQTEMKQLMQEVEESIANLSLQQQDHNEVRTKELNNTTKLTHLQYRELHY